MHRPYRLTMHQPRSKNYHDGDNTSFRTEDDAVKTKGNRHPPHLKGKEIGLFYARRSKQNAKEKESERTPSVSLESNKMTKIQNLLRNLKPLARENVNEWADKYKGLSDSLFKSKFLETYHGNHSSHFADLSTVLKFDLNSLDSEENQHKLDQKLCNEYLTRISSPEYKQLLDQRSKLPIFSRRMEILKAVKENQVIVISGETGCGKSTQVTQFLLDQALESRNGSAFYTICTQPRRIAATSVAQRVAQERCESLGGESSSIGYQIRLERRLPRARGSILYCTTGILVQFLQSDPFLQNVSHLVIDEVHERDVLTDFILTVVRDLLPKRPHLRVILMSATINAEIFSHYFHQCPVLVVPGMTFPVKNLYLEDILTQTEYRIRPQTTKRFRDKSGAAEDVAYTQFMVPYIERLEANRSYPCHVLKSLRMRESEDSPEDLIVELISHICRNERGGAILVFLSGWEQISKLHKTLEADRFFSSRKFLILPLHSMMPTLNQKQVFDRPPPGVRKIILSTNIAETSVTIEDVVYVIDTGRVKLSNFDPAKNLSTLQAEWISLANGRQRQGRAGRTQPGICYRLYTRHREQSFDAHPIPEMQRMRLEELILRVKILKLGRVDVFLRHVPEPPDPRTVQISLDLLQTLGALDSSESLTPLGFHLAQLPTDPRTGKLILLGAIFGCLEPVLSIAAALSFKDPFVIPLNKEEQVRKTKKLLAEGSRSDHLLIARVMRQFRSARRQGWNAAKNYCYQNYLSSNSMSMLSDMADQFCRDLYERQFISNSSLIDPGANVNSDNEQLVRAVMCAGLFPNVAKVSLKKRGSAPPKITTPEDGRVSIHPKSLNYDTKDFESPWLCYHSKVKTSSIFLHDCSEISPLALMVFGGQFERNRRQHGDTEQVDVGKGIEFTCDICTADLLHSLRRHFDDLLRRRVSHPGPTDWSTTSSESTLLTAIVEAVTTDVEAQTNRLQGEYQFPRYRFTERQLPPPATKTEYDYFGSDSDPAEAPIPTTPHLNYSDDEDEDRSNTEWDAGL